MKRIFRLAMAVLTFGALTLACNPAIPFPEDVPDEDPNVKPDPDLLVEKTFTVNVDLIVGVETVSYGMKTVSWPKNELLGFFNMTETEFYHAMGSLSGGSQVDNDIMFGICEDNDHEKLKWNPSTSNNFGHWMTKEGNPTNWGAENKSYWYLENMADWGLDNPGDEDLEAMWLFALGFFPDACDNVPGESIKATHVLYYEADEKEYFAYVEFVLNFVEPEEVNIDIVATQEISLSMPFDNLGDYPFHPLAVDYDALQTALGVPAGVCSVYGVNSDGTYSLAAGSSWWYSVDGDIMSWGAGCGVCIEKDGEDWTYGLFEDEELVGKIIYGAIVFVSEAGKGYLVKLAIDVTDRNIWNLNYEVQVDGDCGEAMIEGVDADAIAAYFGLDGLDALVAALQSGDLVLMPTNADGSYYVNADGTPKYSQTDGEGEKGVFFDLEGNATTWNSGDDKFYSTVYWGVYDGSSYLEIDVTPFAASEDEIGDSSYCWVLTDGEKSVKLVLNITLVSAVPWATVEIADGVYEVKMLPAGGYKAYAMPVDGIAEALGLTAAEYAEAYGSDEFEVYGYAEGERALKEDGTPKYTANGKGGCWFNADGDVDSWGNGLFFIEQDGGSVNLGQHGDAPAAGTSAVLKMEYVYGGKSALITYHVTIVEEL